MVVVVAIHLEFCFNFSSDGEDFFDIWETLEFDSSTNTTQCAYIPIIDDVCVEGEVPEDFIATLKTFDDRVSFGDNSTTISIVDDDCECLYCLVLLYCSLVPHNIIPGLNAYISLLCRYPSLVSFGKKYPPLTFGFRGSLLPSCVG